jgi:hypothetical protein
MNAQSLHSYANHAKAFAAHAARKIELAVERSGLGMSVCLVAICAAWPLLSEAQVLTSNAAESGAASAPFNRLQVGTLVEFDKRTRNVGEAMSSLLAPLRYQLTNRTVDAVALASVLRRPIPAAAMDAGLMSVESGLLLLIGEENRLVVDHRNRLISVEKTPATTATPNTR